jgi:predicted phosphoadenosine phosphosulfate sulfurtransferase
MSTIRSAKPNERMQSSLKIPVGYDVLVGAQRRIAWAFDTFPVVYLSGPSGKDSGVMMHLACLEARKRGRKVGVLYLDLEAQYTLTIDHVREMFALYADVIDPYWLAIPIHLRNAVSSLDPYWICWDETKREEWVRQPPPEAITDPGIFPWYKPPWVDGEGKRTAMEFEEIVQLFGDWYGRGKATCCLVGIRSDESLNRWRTISSNRKARFESLPWTTWKGGSTFNAYPIYDWRTEDVWTYFGKTGLPHNRIYDLMHRAGVPISQMRICQPYGDDQRRGLWLYHVLEPETWERVVQRVAGANMGALYAGKRGNVLGNGKVTLPPGHTWESYAMFLLDSMPEAESDHYKDKIATFISWWRDKRGMEMLDAADPKIESARKAPTWRRIVKVILKNDRICKGLSFGQQTSTATSYEKYKKIMKKRRARWGLFG